jgi:signal transduction histidine kinase
VEVRISDTGPGIPEDMQQRIFEPFFTTKPGGKGTGLGLSVSYGIIKEHKGDIRVESRPGEGCTFVITIPVVKEKGASEPDARVA